MFFPRHEDMARRRRLCSPSPHFATFAVFNHTCPHAPAGTTTEASVFGRGLAWSLLVRFRLRAAPPHPPALCLALHRVSGTNLSCTSWAHGEGCCVQRLGRSWLLLFSLSVVSDFATPWTAARQAALSFTISRSSTKFMSIESVMPSNDLILCHLLLLLPSISPSIRVFSKESVLRIRWPKYWSFSISPSYEYSGLISLRIDWLDLAIQGEYLVQSPIKTLVLFRFFKQGIV